MKTLTYGVRELQAHLGAALRAVERGDRVLITSRGRPVAVLSKAVRRIPGESTIERKLRRMAAEGRIRLGIPGRIPPFRPLPGGGVTRQLLRDRR